MNMPGNLPQKNMAQNQTACRIKLPAESACYTDNKFWSWDFGHHYLAGVYIVEKVTDI